ncbi:hypothetical protein K435DRAFT_960626 [Dendrothele bispora CBS 962.96]|uniref:Fe2OG dioxygenase domain-containing protein n=1 Tax=Dendrothele bispora (strain CBS 962.96) TaxID=1314807 RepID=A0A4S8MT93_DENBC|nr:hypothetical protein K435DRAFT_960626 [Dendrothele bispora CBS 962.96]
MSDSQPHDIQTYLSVRSQLKSLSTYRATGKIVLHSSLIDALARTSYSPWFFYSVDKPKEILDLGFQVGQNKAEAGTISSPNTSVILENAKPSSFGRGSETVYDPEYRKGLEIPAEEITFPNQKSFEDLKDLLTTEVSRKLFDKQTGIKLRLELYKLAVYEEGGHFDWHMDTTHGDDHHATALLFLGSDWEGGDLKLKHGGYEFAQREWIQKEEEEEFVTEDGNVMPVHLIGFYTDVEHKVEPVTKGTRIVLQFDVRVDSDPGSKGKSDSYESTYTWGALDNARVITASLAVHRNQKALDDVAQIIEQRLSESPEQRQISDDDSDDVNSDDANSDDVEYIGFPLRHLYRLASIRPEYLKGVDAMLYEHFTTSQEFKDKFNVKLRPIVLVEETDYEGNWNTGPFFWIFESGNLARKNLKRKRGDEEPPVNESDAAAERSDYIDDEKTQFHLIQGCSLQVIESEHYIEYTGNEAQLGNGKYFGGAMFVSMKKSSI